MPLPRPGLRIVVLAGLLAGAAPPGKAALPMQSGVLVLRDVTVIDGTGAPSAPHRVVLIEAGRIRAVRPLRGFVPPRGAQVIEASGRFLIPGLWDMHVHLTGRPAGAANSRYALPLYVAFGVTGVRDMSGNLGLLTSWRDSVNRGTLIGPRMLVTGYKLGGGAAAVPGAPYPLSSDQDVRETVRLLKRAGADFVKVDQLAPERYPALAEESRRVGLSFVGHVTQTMSLREASRLGQHSVEHLDGALLAISSREDALRARELRKNGRWMRLLFRLHLASLEGHRLRVQREVLESADRARADSLYALLARNQTWQVPTLSGVRDAQMVRDAEPFAEERAPYLPPLRTAPVPTYWIKDTVLARRSFARQVEVLGEMSRAGVPILAGTDTPGVDRVPGFSLVEELELLVRAGLSPMAALQAATREPARFLGLSDSLGTVEPGKAADLVLLDADPLGDIRNVHAVHAVVLRGRYFSPLALDSLRRSVRELVATWRAEPDQRSGAR